LVIVILIAALVGLRVLHLLVGVVLLQHLMLRLLVALLRLRGMLLLEGDQYLLPVPCGSQGVHHLLVLLLLLILRGLLMNYLVLGGLWTPEDGRGRWLLGGLSCHVHGAMRGLDQDGLRLMNFLIDWLRDRGWLIM
jgi:hypothetical protein